MQSYVVKIAGIYHVSWMNFVFMDVKTAGLHRNVPLNVVLLYRVVTCAKLSMINQFANSVPIPGSWITLDVSNVHKTGLLVCKIPNVMSVKITFSMVKYATLSFNVACRNKTCGNKGQCIHRWRYKYLALLSLHCRYKGRFICA